MVDEYGWAKEVPDLAPIAHSDPGEGRGATADASAAEASETADRLLGR